MTLGLLCSGQGLQSPAMFDLVADAPEARGVFEAARAVMGADPRVLVRGADHDALFDNLLSQMLCAVQGLAAGACLAEHRPDRIVLAGYSVGELAAWGLAGIWSAADTLALTRERAGLMTAASGPDDGLGFVRGLARERVEDLAARQACHIAIVNPGRLLVIGGACSDVDAVCQAALAGGAEAAGRLAVKVASHTPKLAAAVAPFRQVAETAPRAPLRAGVTLLSGLDGAPIFRPAAAVAALSGQIAHRLDWAACLEAMVEAGVDRVLELGPGRALVQMVRGAFPAVQARAFDEFHTLEGVRAWIARG